MIFLRFAQRLIIPRGEIRDREERVLGYANLFNFNPELQENLGPQQSLNVLTGLSANLF